ncbi:MAG TPA: hypothetical protein VFY78_09870 [Gammaproteobacteria bacterium]|nr:hypothetical protein [Gammaproteobacteria bacterium]
MSIARKVRKVLLKAVPASKHEYRAPKEKNQSTLTPEQLRKLKNRATKAPTYKIPATPKKSGFGWGP